MLICQGVDNKIGVLVLKSRGNSVYKADPQAGGTAFLGIHSGTLFAGATAGGIVLRNRNNGGLGFFGKNFADRCQSGLIQTFLAQAGVSTGLAGQLANGVNKESAVVPGHTLITMI